MSGTFIPDKARTAVRQRAHQRCERCGVPAPNGQWHHRRSRRVIDSHRHCCCNGLWLCGTCHGAVHNQELRQARKDGQVVSSYVEFPGGVPVRTPWGVVLLGCDGSRVQF